MFLFLFFFYYKNATYVHVYEESLISQCMFRTPSAFSAFQSTRFARINASRSRLDPDFQPIEKSTVSDTRNERNR